MARVDTQGSDRRRSDRAPVEVEVQYETVDELFTEFTRNINEGGLFVETTRPLAVDEAVQLSFKLPGASEAIRVTGRVVRLQTKDEGVAGMGIEFEQLDDAARAAIDGLVRSLRAREGS